MPTNRVETAIAKAKAIPPDAFVSDAGLIVCFDGEYFVGMMPIASWPYVFREAANAFPYDAAVIIYFSTPPPLESLQRQAQECTVTYDGEIHARPVTLLGLRHLVPATTGPTGMLA